MDVVFLITTYNRQESCQRLVDSLQGLGDIVVLGDCVDYIITGCTFFNLKQHNGKYFYWQTVQTLFSLRGKHKYYVMIPDDWMPFDGFLNRAIATWEGISDKKKVCLNILCPGTEGLRNWTGFPAKDMGNVFKTQWVDMCFICEDLFFRALGGLPSTIRSFKSSGVGAYISRKLHKHGFNMYMVKEVLFEPTKDHSLTQMHDEQNNNPRSSFSTRTRKVFDTRNRGSKRPMR